MPKAIEYIEQDLTDIAIFQARKNLDLYYNKEERVAFKYDVTFVDGVAEIDFPVDPIRYGTKIVKIESSEGHSFIGELTHEEFSAAAFDSYEYYSKDINDTIYNTTLSGSQIGGMIDSLTITSSNPDFNNNFTTNLTFYEIDKKLIEEEFIPDTIARVSDVPSDVVRTSKQDLNHEECHQARKNLDLYYEYTDYPYWELDEQGYY